MMIYFFILMAIIGYIAAKVNPHCHTVQLDYKVMSMEKLMVHFKIQCPCLIQKYSLLLKCFLC
ncbi:hypothetical protein HA466_0181760 [Hirschfeldia incana]|nr:hypothetical protein HA466_0181760 [Hirschfeldia incana]